MQQVVLIQEGDNIILEGSKELKGYRKSIPNFSEKKAKSKADSLKSALKHIKQLKFVEVRYSGMDRYDDAHFFLPFSYWKKGDKKVKVEMREYFETPKEWCEDFQVVIEKPKNVVPVEKMLNALGYNNVARKELQKLVKGQKDSIQLIEDLS